MYASTIRAYYIGNLVGTLVTDLPPLLFVTFMKRYGLGFEQVRRLTLINFLTQICDDDESFVDLKKNRRFRRLAVSG